MTSYCPVPGPVPAAAQPRFPARLHHGHDVERPQAGPGGRRRVGASTPLGAEAAQLFNLFASAGNEALDFSAIIKMIGPKAP